MQSRQTGQFSRPCPNCGKIIFAGKYVCEFCGWTDEVAAPEKQSSKQVQVSTKSKKIIGLVGIVGALIILAILISGLPKKGENERIIMRMLGTSII